MADGGELISDLRMTDAREKMLGLMPWNRQASHVVAFHTLRFPMLRLRRGDDAVTTLL